jgi:hypothetical protein
MTKSLIGGLLSLIAAFAVALRALADIGFEPRIVRLRIVAHGAAIYAASRSVVAVSVSHLSLLHLVAFSVCVR